MNGSQLLTAADDGDLAAVRALLAGGADVNESCRNGQTALMLAAARGHLDAVRLLLRAGARVNDRRDDGMTALIHAAFFGHEAVVRALLDGGADLNARDWIGMTPLDWARSKGAMDVVELLTAAESRAARPTLVRRNVRAADVDVSREPLGLPVPLKSTGEDFDLGDNVLDLTHVQVPYIYSAPTHTPPAVAQESGNGNGATRAGAESYAEVALPSPRRPNARADERTRLRSEKPAHVNAQTDSILLRPDTLRLPFKRLPGEPSRPGSERLKELGAATCGSVWGDYLNSQPTSSYKYVGFFFALMFGTTLFLWFLLLML